MARLIEISYPYPYREIHNYSEFLQHYTARDPMLNAVATTYGPRYGDIISIKELREHSDGERELIWEKGGSLSRLDPDWGDYGEVPKQFTVGDDFLADHWFEALGRDGVWIDTAKYRDQLLANLSHRGTYYDAPLGRFSLLLEEDLDPAYSMEVLDKAIKENDTILVRCNGPYSMTFSPSPYADKEYSLWVYARILADSQPDDRVPTSAYTDDIYIDM